MLDLYPYGLKHDRFPDDKATQELARGVVKQTRADVPFVRADWFIATASRPPLYHTLLRIPETAAELEERLGVDVETDFLNDNLVRAGFTKSGVSRQNRLIERHASQYGAYWRSYDFKAKENAGNLFLFPLGPVFKKNPFGKFAFVHAGGEIIFHLPNGLQGYMLVNGQGNRIKEGPIDMVSDTLRTSGTPAIVTGLSCMACHARGLIRDFNDTVREGTAVTGDARNKVRRLHPNPDALKKFLDEDDAMFLGALEKAIGPVLRVKGAERADIRDFAEPIGPIARRYRLQELGPEEVAAELGLDAKNLQDAINSNRRLQELGLGPLAAGDSIKRESWERVIDSGIRTSVFQQTAQELALGDPMMLQSNRESSEASEPARGREAAGELKLKVGGRARIESRSTKVTIRLGSCNSTLISSVDAGRTVKLIDQSPRQSPCGDGFFLIGDENENGEVEVLGWISEDRLEPQE